MALELAWSAGFFDGEGSICVNNIKRHKGGNGTGKYYPCTSVQMSLSQIHPEPLHRFVEAVGCGRVRGPYYPKIKTHSPYYKWQISGRGLCINVINLLWPFLSGPKKSQITRVWDELRDRRTAKSPKLPDLPK